jgi:hypothetical protein
VFQRSSGGSGSTGCGVVGCYSAAGSGSIGNTAAASAEVGLQLRQASKHNNQTQQRLKVTEAAAAA